MLYMFNNEDLGERYSALFLLSRLIPHIVLVLKRVKELIVVGGALRIHFRLRYPTEEAKELE